MVHYRSALGSKAGLDGWSIFSPREEIAGTFTLDASRGGWRDETHAFRVTVRSFEDCRANLARVIDGIEGGAVYRLTAHYQAEGVPDEKAGVFARIVWLDGKGSKIHNSKQEYFGAPGAVPWERVVPEEGGWKTVTGIRVAPDEARAARILLMVCRAPGARVWWSGIELARSEEPRHRVVTLASVFRKPPEPSTPQANVELFCEMLDRAGEAGADLCVLPEAETTWSVTGPNRRKLHEVAEPVSGPVFERHAEHARRWNMYVVACYPERDRNRIYNTAILIGRDGRLVGKYRKTHVPVEEHDNGHSPGSGYPVFETDFGRVGMMICWDAWFPEVARALAVQGARVLLVPMAGCHEYVLRTRALENHVFIVSSTYTPASCGVIDPRGEWLDAARADGEQTDPATGKLTRARTVEEAPSVDPAAGKINLARVDLDEPRPWSYAGDHARRLHIERRADLADILARGGAETAAPSNGTLQQGSS